MAKPTEKTCVGLIKWNETFRIGFLGGVKRGGKDYERVEASTAFHVAKYVATTADFESEFHRGMETSLDENVTVFRL